VKIWTHCFVYYWIHSILIFDVLDKMN